jgi:NAD(P)-dependent dehydrogenase (short-subunit alcohol dehydrogenase family)
VATSADASHRAVFEGYRALVIGVETPVGREIARALGRTGADLGLAAMRPDEGVVAARRIQRELRELGRTAAVYVMDVTLGRNAQVTTRQVAKELGGLDVVVSAPDAFLERPLAAITELELAQVTQYNYFAHVYAARAAAAEFRRGEAGDRGALPGVQGRLLIVTHALGRSGVAGVAAYGGACAAACALVSALAAELAASGVAVSGLVRGASRGGNWRTEDAAGLAALHRATDEAEAADLAALALRVLSATPAEVGGEVFDVTSVSRGGAPA